MHPRRELVAALNTADGQRALAAAANETGSLQLAGDGYLLALEQDIEGAGEPARQLAAQLRQRGWAGDLELADELEPGLQPDNPPLAPINVDLDELADALDEGHGIDPGRIDLNTGVVWSAAAIDNSLDAGLEIEDLDNPDRWLLVDGDGPDSAFGDIRSFLDTITEPDLRDRLEATLHGRGAFRKYRNALDQYPYLKERWLDYSDDRRRGRARQWLARHHYRAVAPPRG